MDDSELLSFIDKAIGYSSQKLKDYEDYPPIYNSRIMLGNIKKIVNEGNDISDDERKLMDVGLLAAKALDFDSKFKEYASILHQIWQFFLGFLNAQVAVPSLGSMRIAFNFYLRHGYFRNQIMSHLSGIDFSQPLNDRFMLHNENIVTQWCLPCIPQGDYYTEKQPIDKNHHLPGCVGVNAMQEDYLGNVGNRIEHKYSLNGEVIVLKSVAAAVFDTWSVKGLPVRTEGGCIQYFNANDKSAFIFFL